MHVSGDKFNIPVSSCYKKNGTTPQSPNSIAIDLVTGIINSLTGTGGPVHGAITPTQLTNSGVIPISTTNFLNAQPAPGSTKPKAYINWVFLDEQFKFVSTGSDAEQVGNDQEFKVHMKIDLPVTKNGYLYVFVSNETPDIDVYFDNLQVTHTRGPILEETHYYPFGLVMSGISSKSFGSLPNKYKFGGKELQSNEFSDGSGMELYDFQARNYDPQIGRWWSSDLQADRAPSLTPYRYAFNNPVRFFDPNGKYEEDGHYWTVYLLATQLKLSNAAQLAAATEWPDVAAVPTYLIPGLQQRYHALTGGNAGYETRKSEQMIYDAGDDMKDIGIGLHRYGDSYAHRTLSDPSVMYGNSIFTMNHAWKDGAAPDKISNRPGLYLEYVQNLNRILDKKFGKTGQADMFTFNYVAGASKNTSQNNDDIFKSEISILNGVNTFEIDGTSAGAVGDYLKARKKHDASTQDYSIKTVEVTKYELSDDGIWVGHKENQTFVTANH